MATDKTGIYEDNFFELKSLKPGDKKMIDMTNIPLTIAALATRIGRAAGE